MQYLEVAGRSLAYDVVGQGRPVVMIAGWGSDHRTWEAQIPRLSEKCQLILLDSAAGGFATTEDLARDVGAVLEHLDLPPALLVGHSLGGMVAQQVARLYPQRVRALQLVCTTARSSPRLNFILATWLRSCELDTNLLLEVMLSWVFTDRLLGDPAFLALARAAWKPLSVETLRAQTAAVRTHNADLAAIRVPTLVVVGEEDIVNGPDDAAVLMDGIDGARLEVLEGCGHACMVEAAEAFTDCVLRFEGLTAQERPIGFRRR